MDFNWYFSSFSLGYERHGTIFGKYVLLFEIFFRHPLYYILEKNRELILLPIFDIGNHKKKYFPFIFSLCEDTVEEVCSPLKRTNADLFFLPKIGLVNHGILFSLLLLSPSQPRQFTRYFSVLLLAKRKF